MRFAGARQAPSSPPQACSRADASGRACSPRSTAPASTAAALQRNKDLGQADLFGGGDEPARRSDGVPLPDVPPWTEIEQLNYEKEALGLYWTGHPIDRYAEDLRDYGAKTTADLLPKKDAVDDDVGRPTRGAATAVAAGRNGDAAATAPERPRQPRTSRSVASSSGLRPLKTRKGDRMCVFMLDDADGSLEVVVFPEAFKQFGHLAENGQMVVVKGKFERDDESARLLASEIAPIEIVRERLATSVAIRLSTPPHDRATFEKLWDVLRAAQGRPARGVRHRAAGRRTASCG